MIKPNTTSLYLILLILINSCVKLNPVENINNVSINGNGLILIGNEGNFQYGNASLSGYNKNSKEIINNLYQNINQEPIGDVLHNISHIDHQLFLVVNNSGKVIVIDDESFLKSYEIKNLTSPRKIIKVDNSKYYITDIYANKIFIHNQYDHSLSEISLNGWSEDMRIQNGKVFVGNITNNMVYVINSSNDSIMDSIQVGSSPISIQEDSRGNLWVLSQGSQSLNESPSISIIETQNHSIIKSFYLENNQSSPSYLNMDIETNKVFLINKHIYKFQNIDDTLPQIIWPNNNNNFYNLKINPYNKDLYMTDAKDYVQNGSLIIIDSIGNFKNEVTTGIIPKSIVF